LEGVLPWHLKSGTGGLRRSSLPRTSACRLRRQHTMRDYGAHFVRTLKSG